METEEICRRDFSLFTLLSGWKKERKERGGRWESGLIAYSSTKTVAVREGQAGGDNPPSYSATHT